MELAASACRSMQRLKSFQIVHNVPPAVVMCRDLAFRRFPIIRFDRMEPFLPVRIGFSVFREPADSNVDYKRKLGSKAALDFDVPGLDMVIEYGIWWDWDIEHLYELEAIWVYLGRDGRYLRVEASWHGGYNDMMMGGDLRFAEGRPVLYSQPGKHAFAPTPLWFEPKEKFTPQCAKNAGSRGLLVTPLFEGRITKDAEADQLAGRFLAAKAFVPSFEFSKEWRAPRAMFVPWRLLEKWIPGRVEELISRLKESGAS